MMDAFLGVIMLFGALFLYFLPTMLAYRRYNRNAGAIFALNFFLGWTLLGWVAALVWALTKDLTPPKSSA
jgi:hypothetical protein